MLARETVWAVQLTSCKRPPNLLLGFISKAWIAPRLVWSQPLPGAKGLGPEYAPPATIRSALSVRRTSLCYYPCAANKNSHLVHACRLHVLSIMPAHIVASAVRGFHVYYTVWTPSIGEELATTRERRYPHDRFSVAAVHQPVGRRLLKCIPRDEFGGGEAACSRTPYSVRL